MRKLLDASSKDLSEALEEHEKILQDFREYIPKTDEEDVRHEDSYEDYLQDGKEKIIYEETRLIHSNHLNSICFFILNTDKEFIKMIKP